MSANIFTLLLLSVRVWSLGRTLADSVSYGYRLEALDNLIFTDSLLFQSSASASLVDCAQTCARHGTCVAFTFIASSGLCRGHSAFSSLNQSRSDAAGAKTWVLGCPEAAHFWRVSPSRCLRLFLCEMPHAEAGSRCVQDGGGLFMMKTWDDRALLGAFLAAQGQPFFDVWLGGEQLPGEGEWVWGDGENLPLNHSLWHPGEPSGTPYRADCLATWKTYLDDYDCDTPLPFVCDGSLP